jgi:hypothetical protein
MFGRRQGRHIARALAAALGQADAFRPACGIECADARASTAVLSLRHDFERIQVDRAAFDPKIGALELAAGDAHGIRFELDPAVARYATRGEQVGDLGSARLRRVLEHRPRPDT